jgi:hypothetical protein
LGFTFGFEKKSNVAHMAARKWRCLMEKHDQLLQRRKEKQQDDFELLNLLRLPSLGDVLIQPNKLEISKNCDTTGCFSGLVFGTLDVTLGATLCSFFITK